LKEKRHKKASRKESSMEEEKAGEK